ncbi:phosphate acetyltransferase [Aliiroseovarius halocynthiae]|uniref:Phosphate acetyltransferase n=1 Tax=Aliiroseovarius halocynthiae TaxID=985055 RepID=A0A545SSK3_9RHOB|nr:phosphate acetyltransferase [Aliiroseovarius halocynthiae]TQV67942.1 phosphate acetyltransferase [Aliiroseovarius halocynthiae]SMR73044.1 phosphate acetyltransferase [Aliiroseovarius halocynthiae]
MKPLETLLKNAARTNLRIILSEGSDPRAVSAGHQAAAQGIARIGLVGDSASIKAEFEAQGIEIIDGIDIHDPSTSPLRNELAALYYQLRQHKGVTHDDAQAAVDLPHIFAALLVKSGHADGTVGGAVATTADIVRAAIQIIGTKPDTKLISSFFLMLFCKEHHDRKGAMIFADSGLVVDPSADEMAQIALSSANSFQRLIGETPRVAMLSFSTRGSAEHDAVSKVVTATETARSRAPELLIDGELQFDAAFVPDVAARKAQDSPLQGNANVFIFPNLESGNIAYKIAQRMGGAEAIGPILQGLAKPANDLSRGCSAEDILHMIAVTAAQASDSD